MMRKYFLFLTLYLLLTSCTASTNAIRPDFSAANKQTSLYTIKISHNNQPQFTGILALELRGKEVYTILLDATGMSLFEGLIEIDGSITISKGLEEIKKRKLPELIASMIWAVYLTPAEVNCPWYQAGCIERNQTSKQQMSITNFQLFIFQIWKANVKLNNGIPDTVKYSLNFQDVEIIINRIKD